MNANSFPGDPSEKRAILPGCVPLIFLFLRMFWFTILSLLIVVLYGRHAGWSAPQQWSDGFFIAALAQVMTAGVSLLGTQGEAYHAASVRYLADGNINETLQRLLLDTFRMKRFAIGTFIGSLLTALISMGLLWV
jgi:hypothetical protein